MGQRLTAKARLRPYALSVLVLMLFAAAYGMLRGEGMESVIRYEVGVGGSSSKDGDWPPAWHENLFMNEDTCARTFPGLFKEIDDAVAMGPFDLPFKQGAIMQAKIEDGQLFIIRPPTKADLSPVMRQRQRSTLHQLHRALLTSPDPLPDTPFAFATQDVAVAETFSFARPAAPSPSGRRVFPMPHFAFWSWPLPFVRSLPAAQRAVAALEAAMPFTRKDPRAVWRGTPWFGNGAGAHPNLRHGLIKIAGGGGGGEDGDEKDWADVQELLWEHDEADAVNALRIEDFCRYRYVIHTEGIGYSGRLQFHQLCESVVLSPPFEWMQHTSHLIRPVFSSTLLGTGAPATPVLWHAEAPADEANMVFVAADWSDLEATVGWLEAHPDVAAGIARRQRQTYALDGFLSPAAEVCYWRALVRGWSKVARPVGEGWDGEAMPFEEFVSGAEDGR